MYRYTSKICSTFLYLTVAAQEAKGPGIVIVHPGQNVTLLCTLNLPTTTQHTTVWIINHAPRGVQSLINGILHGYSADVNNDNLIVQNIVMNDNRNDTEHQCVIVISGTTTVVNRSEPTFLYVAGKYRCYVRMYTVEVASGTIKYMVLYKITQSKVHDMNIISSRQCLEFTFNKLFLNT